MMCNLAIERGKARAPGRAARGIIRDSPDELRIWHGFFPRHLGAILPSDDFERMTIGRLIPARAAASVAVPRSAAKSPGTFAGEWRPPPSGTPRCGRD